MTNQAAEVAKRRTFAIISHPDAGKTTITEKLLLMGKAIAVAGTVNQQVSAQQSLVDALARTYRISVARYTKGIDNYLGVLDAQRSLYTAEQVLIALRLGKLANQVRLYAVLGGGSD